MTSSSAGPTGRRGSLGHGRPPGPGWWSRRRQGPWGGAPRRVEGARAAATGARALSRWGFGTAQAPGPRLQAGAACPVSATASLTVRTGRLSPTCDVSVRSVVQTSLARGAVTWSSVPGHCPLQCLRLAGCPLWGKGVGRRGAGGRRGVQPGWGAVGGPGAPPLQESAVLVATRARAHAPEPLCTPVFGDVRGFCSSAEARRARARAHRAHLCAGFRPR